MLKYLIIQLDDTSTSFCHYPNSRTERKLIELDDLKAAIFWAMKENLMIQFLYPDYELPREYSDAIESIDHVKIKPAECGAKEDILVANSFDGLKKLPENVTVVLRVSSEELKELLEKLRPVLANTVRLNVVITDAARMGDEAIALYAEVLDELAGLVKSEYEGGHAVQLNLLTDRMLLDAMNNCNAGWESLTVAPDGKFYICPAFYLDGESSVGSPAEGLDIRNPQLFRLDHAPICRNCDAYQCRRCVWLNKKMTLEVNTPSHEQCITAHTERNASRKLLAEIRKLGEFLPEKEIPEIDYTDPFDKIAR